MLFDLSLLVGGWLLLYVGGDWLVEGARGLAAHLGVSPIFIAIVVMGFGTSAPEIIVTVDAVLSDRSDVGLGNVVGSNIANLFLILAGTAVLAPMAITPGTWRVDGMAMLVATVGFAALAMDGLLSRFDAGLLIVAMVTYLCFRLHADTNDGDHGDTVAYGKAAFLAAGGIILLPVGAHIFVEGAVNIATRFGVSDAIIGLTLVAIGTSLPELTASLSAARKGRADMALGNILGSGVFNSTIVIGSAALLVPITIPPIFLDRGLWLMIAVAVITIVFLRTGYRLGRREGAVMLAGYATIMYLMPTY